MGSLNTCILGIGCQMPICYITGDFKIFDFMNLIGFSQSIILVYDLIHLYLSQSDTVTTLHFFMAML